MKVDLGAGGVREKDWLAVDIAGTPDVRCDIRRLPFRSESIVALRALHVLEHVRREDLVSTMNECHRVLISSGMMDVEVPIFPSDDAIADPTHLSFFVSRTFDYFLKAGKYDDHRQQYGIAPWYCVSRERAGENSILRVVLMKAGD